MTSKENVAAMLRASGGPPFKIKKIDAAKRQLQTAVELWFLDGDPVSIHSLAYAAHEIIHRLFRKQGGSDLMFDSSNVKDEYRDEFCRLLKEDANFFKHADRETNPDEVRDFHPGRNILFIAICITGLQRMKLPLEDSEHAFLFWLSLHIPDWFLEDVSKDRIPVERLEKMRAMNKAGFLDGFLEVRRQQRAMGLIK